MLTVIIGNRFMTIHVNVYSYACKWLTLDDTSDTDYAIRYYSHIESRCMIRILTHTLR